VIVDETYTVADLIEATRAPRRTVQFWADKRVIEATKATQEGGQGVHRLFTRKEAIIACLVRPVSLGWQGDQTRSLSELIKFAETIRRLLKRPVTSEEFDSAIAGNGEFYLILTWVFGGGIETAIENAAGSAKLFFPGVMGRLKEQSGRSEVLYLNEWLRPLRDM
jgi:hypothetical protein